MGIGIDRIQACFDLADFGRKVFLVEKKISIGRVMAQLDRIFPMNDGSANVKIPTQAEVQEEVT